MWMSAVFKGSSDYVACIATCGPSFLCNLGLCLISPHVDSVLHVLSPFPRILVSRAFTVLHFTNSMLLWRSFWAFFDMVFITDLSLILSFTLTTLVFVGFACFNTLNGVPASVELDWMGQKEYCTVSTLMQDRDFSHMSRCGVACWRLVDALCTGVLEVLGILAWYGVYQYVVENLPTAPEVGSSQLCGHLLYLTMAGQPPHRKPASNSTGFCHWPLGADASGSNVDTG